LDKKINEIKWQWIKLRNKINKKVKHREKTIKRIRMRLDKKKLNEIKCLGTKLKNKKTSKNIKAKQIVIKKNKS
jgi:hypothetical protein